MNILLHKLHPEAVVPSYARAGDAGLDLTAISLETKRTYQSYSEFPDPTCVYTYGTGLAIEIPDGYVGLIYPRSSIHKTGMQLCNSVGVIDSGYRGELMIKFYTDGPAADRAYQPGDRIAQLIILPYPQVNFVLTDKLSTTDRGDGGFGSTEGMHV